MIASLSLGLFNSGLFDCWIAPYPQGCTESWRIPKDEHGNQVPTATNCERGDNASLYQWVFDVIPKWVSVLVVTLNMILTNLAVRRQELSTIRFSQPEVNPAFNATGIPCSSNADGSVSASVGTQGRNFTSFHIKNESSSIAATANDNSGNIRSFQPRQRQSTQQQRPKKLELRISRRLARQSYLYVGALYLTYIPVVVTRSFELVNGFVHYEMLLTIGIMIPLQGFWNVMVYLRPRLLQRRRERKEQERRQIQRTFAERRNKKEQLRLSQLNSSTASNNKKCNGIGNMNTKASIGGGGRKQELGHEDEGLSSPPASPSRERHTEPTSLMLSPSSRRFDPDGEDDINRDVSERINDDTIPINRPVDDEDDGSPHDASSTSCLPRMNKQIATLGTRFFLDLTSAVLEGDLDDPEDDNDDREEVEADDFNEADDFIGSIDDDPIQDTATSDDNQVTSKKEDK
jgi:hypothetical protein